MQRRAITFLGFMLLSGCGGAGTALEQACGLCGAKANVRGAISSQFGDQSTMVGWVVAILEKNTGISRVAEVDSSGTYVLKQVKTEKAHTLALLSPDYVLRSVLSIPGTLPNTIRQFFTIKETSLPRLIQNGPIVQMQTFDKVGINKDLASDADADQIPDGSVSLGAVIAAPAETAASLHLRGVFRQEDQAFDLRSAPMYLQASDADLDLDKTPNQIDPDIDGDGIINVLDPDDDGDAIIDVVDGDSNGDLINDESQTIGDLFYPEGVEFVAVQFEMKPKADGSGNETTLKFTTKVRKNVQPIAVQIRGAPNILNSATVAAIDTEGNVASTPWDRRLADDGASEDDQQNDRLFAKKVTLENGVTPRAHETVFFQLVFGSEADPWYLEFPYVFPDLAPTAITAQYDALQKKVFLIGNPYGETLQTYKWSINVYDENDQIVWPSPAIDGTINNYAIQDNVLIAGKTYTYSVVAQVLAKVPGYPAYTIHSARGTLQ